MIILRLPPALAAILFSFLQCLPAAEAQYPPPATYDNILTSKINPKVSVSYKQPPAGTCMTAFSKQKQYTGYINIPPGTLAPIQQDYNINTFFWFIEARQSPETAPLTIWLNGGPGSSSMFGVFDEVGPCEVVQMADGSYGTRYRQWGWDRTTNILFIDQPNQVGFSFDTPTNATLDLFTNELNEQQTALSDDLPTFMYLNGTFGSASDGDSRINTSNTTEIAAHSVWHFLQTWLSTFPQYNPALKPNSTYTNSTTPPSAAGIHLFTESYGGKYGPAFATFFEEQNDRIANGSLSSTSALLVQLETLGIINGWVDDAIQNLYYPTFAYNNTYGIKAINQADELNTLNIADNDCTDAIKSCRAAMNTTDPNGDGDQYLTNLWCKGAYATCSQISAPYYDAGYSPYDIRQKYPSPDPPAAYQEYLNNASVLAAIGARVNYTSSNSYVQAAFLSTGDSIRGGQLSEFASLLARGIRVAFVYGDADYICNWQGGQAVSLALAGYLPDYPSQQIAPPASPPYSTAFPAAGYADIVTNASYIGGSVRQFGNLSFSRIYDAGHFVPYYQPETAFTVFTRIIYGTDISTGKAIDVSSYGTTGPVNSTHTNSVPPMPSQTCWVRSVDTTCSDDDRKAIMQGKGMVAHGIYYQDNSSVTLPGSTVVAGVPGQPTSSSTFNSSKSSGTTSLPGLTGVYTATGTPSPTGAATSRSMPALLLTASLLPVVCLLGGIFVGVAAVV